MNVLFSIVVFLVIAGIVFRYYQVKKNLLTTDETTAVIAATILYLSESKAKSPELGPNISSPWGLAAIYQGVTRRNNRGRV
jgi:hypothetical protein